MHNKTESYIWIPLVGVLIIFLGVWGSSLAMAYRWGYYDAGQKDDAVFRVNASSTAQEFEAMNCQRENDWVALDDCESGKPIPRYEMCSN